MKRREHISPDLTPLIDVIFLILIFFMVSSTFKKDVSLDLTLPSTKSTTEIKKEDLTIELTQKELAFKGKKCSFQKINEMLKNIKNKNRTINIKIDKKVVYQRIARLFDLLNQHQLNNIALETVKKDN